MNERLGSGRLWRGDLALPAWLRTPGAAAVGTTAVWVGVACGFAVQQEIWVDETSQLSGLTLGPIEVVRWLAGHERARFGVPGGSAPPLSFWGGWLWSQVFGLSEGSLRTLGVVLGACSTALVALTAGRRWGVAAAWVAGLAFALSPNVVEIGVEIRPYPFLLLYAAAAFSLLTRQGPDPEHPPRWHGFGLTVTALLASATHFFGVVMAGATLLAALWMGRRGRWNLRAALPALVVLLALPAIVPFMRSTMDDSSEAAIKNPPFHEGGEATRGRPVARYVYRILGGHPAHQVFLPFLVATLGGATALLGVALRLRDRSTADPRVLLMAIVAGGAVTLVGHLLAPHLEVLSPRYSSWMLPGLAIAAGSAVSAEDKRFRRVAWAGAALLLVGNAGATAVLIRDGSAFAHTPADRIIRAIRSEGGVTRVAVVHDPSRPWGGIYYPLRYAFGPDLRQYRPEEGTDGAIALKRLPDSLDASDAGDADRLLLVTSRPQGASEIAAFLRTGRAPELLPGSLDAAVVRAGWERTGGETLMGMTAAEVRWYRRSRR